MMGGWSEHAVDNTVKDLAKNNLAALNAKTGEHAKSYTVNKAWTQVVAGTNYFLHLTDDHGHKHSAIVFVPLGNGAAQVSWAGKDHTVATHH